MTSSNFKAKPKIVEFYCSLFSRMIRDLKKSSSLKQF